MFFSRSSALALVLSLFRTHVCVAIEAAFPTTCSSLVTSPASSPLFLSGMESVILSERNKTDSPRAGWDSFSLHGGNSFLRCCQRAVASDAALFHSYPSLPFEIRSSFSRAAWAASSRVSRLSRHR